MGAKNFKSGIRYEVQDHKHGDFEIYGYKKDENGNEQYHECWWITRAGIVFGYEVWSSTFGEFEKVDLKQKTSSIYLDRVDEVREFLVIAMEEYQYQKGMAI